MSLVESRFNEIMVAIKFTKYILHVGLFPGYFLTISKSPWEAASQSDKKNRW